MYDLFIEDENFEYIGYLSDFGCYVKRLSVASPQPKISTIDIPYADGTRELLPPTLRYNNRRLIFNIVMVADDAMSKYSRMCSLMAGKKCRIYIYKDGESTSGEYAFEGRMNFGNFQSNKKAFKFTVTVDAFPFMLSKWKERTCVIFKNDETGLRVFNETIDGDMITVPEFSLASATDTISTRINVSLDGDFFPVRYVGINRYYENPEAVLYPTSYLVNAGLSGSNTIEIRGTGTVRFKWREGKL